MKKLFAFGAILVGVFLISKKSNAQSGTNPTPVNNNNQNTSGSGNVVITDHDAVWDYKRENGQWFTKKKSSGIWIDMKKALSPENYKIAITRLESHLNKKSRKIIIVS